MSGGGYPLLLNQNGWGGSGRHTSTTLLRSLGAELSRPTQATAHSYTTTRTQAHHDIEVHVEAPQQSFFRLEYPQPPARTHRTPPVGGSADTRDTRFGSDGGAGVKMVPRLQTVPRCPDTTPVSPRASPRPRRGGGTEASQSQVPVVTENHRGSNGTGRCAAGGVGAGLAAGPGPMVALGHMGPTRPSQLSLCCSSPDYYYNSEERVRQEPEPGLLNCCDAKVSCCPCCPCCRPYCPTGHMNTVCMALICSGIITFIVLSPLFHYLIPT
ncbi:hypothetical protein Pmani_035785 [Petrolisthes manimaculis]|uniref:Uncharacterized protein n=1 Tax=Petrolisthes manimaculis TaxID=1843537 RepID=A0AAE1NLM2_9EUCA|nr:hypothetical protein Pmani_035785 [Petrolisthes manimaculis]